MNIRYLILFTLLTVSLTLSAQKNKKWKPLFNGRNLKGWTAKITGYPLGENFGKTFRVADGKLVVSYDQYDSFNNRFGHLFYKTPFTHYILAIEYRFTGTQITGGPSWAYKNSGVMLHCQPPITMTTNQDFPISLENQFLEGDSSGIRPTCNLCTPGTDVLINGKKPTDHCIKSSSPTFRNGE